MFVVLSSFAFTGCSDDDDDAVSADYASAISGTYTGKLLVANETAEDAFPIRLSRVSNTVCTAHCDIISWLNGTNFNISLINGQYVLENATEGNMTFIVTGKTMLLTFSNTYGAQVSFTGVRD